MSGGYHLCIDTSNLTLRSDQDERCILHVQFHGTGKNDYTVVYEKLESTLFTEFLKERIGLDFHEMLMKLTFNITPTQDANGFCERVLARGIHCRQRVYTFLGHSEMQLKEKSCYLITASHAEILAQIGDFLGERHVGKRARKIGMLFSPLSKPLPLNSTQYKIEPDIKRGVFRSYTFTDGCGFMSPEFSNEVKKNLKLDYQPSCIHVRYRGIEGMLVLKEDLTDVEVQFHQSMQKFVTPAENMPESFNFIDVVDYCCPYQNGYLDIRMIMLLADRGIPVENLLELQSGYHEMLEGMCRETAEYFLRFKGEFSLLRDIQVNGIDGKKKKQLKFFRNQELDEMKNAPGNARILVPKSRVVFAVCDPYNKLKYGECYFNPTMPEDEAKTFPSIDQKFVVTRSPCYHPGDVRVLRLTDNKQGYENLRDCLVLPVKGSRPHAFECAGGTLGGKKYFVSWNENLLPKKAGKPCDYPLKKAPGIREILTNVATDIMQAFWNHDRNRNDKGLKEMRQYFATFTDDLTERIDETYMKYAAVFGPSSKECKKLGKWFYQAVNLMGDRVILEKEWSRLKERESTSSMSSGDPSSSTACSENSPGLLDEELDPGELENDKLDRNEDGCCRDENIRQPSPRCFMRRSRRPCNPGNEVREKIEVRAKEFVERVQREFRKSVA